MRSAFARGVRGVGATTGVVVVLVAALATPAHAAKRPDTVIDSAPASLVSSTTAAFTFHSTITPATFTCRLDASASSACTSPVTYTGLADGRHTFSVFATSGGTSDPQPATASWTVDSTPPSVPANVKVFADRAPSVSLNWSTSSDANGVAGYDVFRNGSLLASLGTVTSYVDTTVSAATTYNYTMRARDVLGNASAQSVAVTASTPAPFDAHLTRAPYLTDLVGLNVIVNFATDQSGSAATVRFGAVSNGTCSLTTTVNASHVTISVNSVFEYQWKANLVLPATGTYCYRVYLGPVDLLAANVSPQFQTQVPLGSTQAYSFAVFGDWGQTDINGQNPDQANVMRQVAASGARFAVMTGDTAYPSGSQGNYGDLQQGGGVFGPAFWTQPGSSIPAFVPAGNHGLARSDVNHPLLADWPEDAAVATSGGRYQKDTYCCVNGTNSADYPSMWYAFDAGTARFYVLDVAWADLNTGTATPYANEAAAHWTPTSPEYQWLLADLNAHPSGLKFAFFHYPLYSDQPSENSDTSLQGNSSLEGLLASKGVNIAFNGHAHIYERNTPATGTGVQSLTTYVTGGAGGDIQSLGTTCLANDAYAIGWSDTNSVGSKCGTARVPTARSQVFHFLKVTVSGSTVTVTPTDENGNTFDVKTYSFKTLPDTYIDSAPPAGTTSSTASFTFHSSGSTATFTCKLDNGAQQSCTSPKSYTGLAQGAHTFSVFSTVNKVADPLPATATWTVDSTAPTTPTNFSASPTSPFSVGLSWTAATDNTGVTGYDIVRDGVTLTTVSAATSYVDTAVVGASTHTYAVRARDIAGNLSPPTSPITVTTPPPPPPLFADGFESGDLSAWTSSGGLAPEATLVHGGTTAVEGNTTNGGTFAKKTLSSTYTDAYARVFFDVVSQTDQINLVRMRDAAGNSLGYLYVAPDGSLGFHDDITATNSPSTVVAGPGWHALELHLGINGAASTVEVWLDNVQVTDLSIIGAVDLGTAPVGQLQIGEVQAARTYDVAFDDVAFGNARLGPVADNSPPSVPGGVSAAATSPFSIDVSWLPSIDDNAVSGYDVLRNGVVIASTDPSTTSYTDQTVSPSSAYTYTVRARDASGNLSAQSAPAGVTTPSVAVPVFADGFESGNLNAWTSSAGLSVENSDVRTGALAAEGNTVNGGTFARKTLATTYTDAYARVAVEIKSQASQVNLLRLRDATGASIGFLYVSANGHLGFHDDATATNNASVVTVGSGWHALELHLGVNGPASTVEVWLDDTEVPDLSVVGAIDLGTAPVGQFQIGDAQTGLTYDVVFDDAGFGIGRLGAAGDGTPPSVPANLNATAASAFSVALSWTASTDDTAVAAYDISRDGNVIASVNGATTAFTDTSVLASSTYSYTVRARDVWGNTSSPSASAGVTTPAAAAPLFADGFESGNLGAWTSSAGLAIESTDVRSGAFAAEGNTTNGNTVARRALGSTYADAYARVGFEIKSQSSQINLLRLRDATGVSIGYVYVTTAGALGFHNDATATNTTSTTTVGGGWHSVEMHLNVSGTTSTVEVWLDGVPVSGLTAVGSANLGTATVGQLQIGEAQTARTYDVIFDDAAFGTSRLGI